jgi:hypothetical protein
MTPIRFGELSKKEVLIFKNQKIFIPIPDMSPYSYVEFEDRIIVQFFGKHQPDDNVFAFGTDGKVLWRIQPYFESPDPIFGPDPYTSVAPAKSQGRVLVYTWSGHQAYVDPLTGEIERIDVGRPW